MTDFFIDDNYSSLQQISASRSRQNILFDVRRKAQRLLQTMHWQRWWLF